MNYYKIEAEKLEQNLNDVLKMTGESVSQTIAKPHVVGSLFALYPNSEMMGLADENKPVAWFKYKEHAEEFGKAKYGKYYVVKTWA